MKHLLVTVSLAMSIPFIGASQGILIDSSTRNGSFESGVAIPWLGGIQVTQNAAFASQGSWYSSLQAVGSGTAREIAFQNLPANRNDGLTFIATFDARDGLVGFDSLSVDFFGRNTDGSIVGATEVPVTFPSLSGLAWGAYQLHYELPAAWDGGGGVSLQILFSKHGAVSGTTYVGYLDNVTLEQVPEPSTLALFGVSGLLALGGLRWRRWPNKLAAGNAVWTFQLGFECHRPGVPDGTPKRVVFGAGVL